MASILDDPIFKTRQFETIEESQYFLKNFLAPYQAEVEAMTDEQRNRFVNAVMELGSGTSLEN